MWGPVPPLNTLWCYLLRGLLRRRHRMYACARALVWGEDFTSDPVSKAVGYALQYFSGGTLTINVPLMSQVYTDSPGNSKKGWVFVSPDSNFASCHGLL